MLFSRTLNALVVQVCIVWLHSLANPDWAVEGSPVTGQWGQWSAWSPCSAECRTGVTSKNRTCQHYPASLLPLLASEHDKEPRCEGQDKEIKLCNKQECADGGGGWRERECTKFDSSLHSGRRYTWEPFTHASDPCALTCRAKGHHFYTTLADRVVDGTPCRGATSNPSAICLQGICEEVGCDDVVGSPWRRDACGVCRGDNSSCRRVSGVFSEEPLDEGMNRVTLIPAGSTLINITGLRYSINWLALQNEKGDYFLNGGEVKSPAGDYEAAGTIFSYKTSQKCSGQCITAQGPIDQAIKLMLNTRGANRGVEYSFNVPNDVTDDYFRQIIDRNSHNASHHETSSKDGDGHFEIEENGGGEDQFDVGEDDDIGEGEDGDDGVSHFVDSDSSVVSEEESEGREEEGEEGEEREQPAWEEQNGNQEEEEEEEEEEWLREKQDQELDQDFDNVSYDEKDDLYLYENDEENEEAEKPSSEDDISDDDDDESDSDSASMSSESNEEESDEDNIISPLDKKSDKGNSSQQNHENNNDDDDYDEFLDSESSPDDAEVGAPEPLLKPKPENNDMEIIKKAQPEFVNPEDVAENSVTGNAGSSESQPQAESESLDDLVEASQESSTHDPSTTDPNPDQTSSPAQHPTTTQTPHTSTDQHSSTSPQEGFSLENDSDEESSEVNPTKPYSDQPQSDTRVTHRQTPAPDHSSSPGEDGSSLPRHSPASPQHPARHSDRRANSRRRFRRPNFSQSFTFKRRFNRQRGRADPNAPVRPENRVDASNSGNRVDPSRVNSGSRVEAPRITTSRVNTPAPVRRRIRFRIPPRRQDPRWLTVGALTGYRQPVMGRNPYQRPHNQGRHHRPSQRQALTLGQSGSQEEEEEDEDDGSLTIRQGPRAVSPTDTNLQSRLDSNRRRHEEQQREYARQQEEYRREMRRRRQKMEQQRAAQQAEYQRRLEEHNRRLQQRKLEQQRRQQQHQNHQNRRRHGHQHHHRHHNGRHRQHQQNLHVTIPTNGNNRVVSPGKGLPTQRGNDVRYGLPGRVSQTTPPSYITPVPQRTDSPPRRQNVIPAIQTPAPTQIFIPDPDEVIIPARPTLYPNSISGGAGPVAPQYIPEESREDTRSSLSGPSSNEIPDGVITPLVIGPEGNVVPTVNERGLLIGREGGVLEVEEGGGDKMAYEWRISGLTDCSLTCGGGMQQSAVVCLDTRTQAVVTNGNCAHVAQPEIQTVTCNTRPCPAEWQSSQWAACSVSCGPGEQTRLVACTARVSPTLNLTRPEENCQGQVKPEARRQCQNAPCTSWKTGEWSQCSVQCGEGVRNRNVYCADQTGYDVSDDLCPGSKPEAEEACEMGPCGKGWYYTQWSDKCPAQCGSGKKARRVACMGEGGVSLPHSSCDPLTRPDPQQPCRSPTPCGGQWFAGEWMGCNVTCGEGHQNREVLCMKSSPGRRHSMVGDENCVLAAKPETTMPCKKDACAVEWFVTSWTKCSQSCGAGQRTREVKCLDPQERSSSDCPLAGKPRTREACNTHKCAVAKPPASAGSAECRDSFSRCELVLHARMCRYPFYKKKCCATCSQDL